MTKLLSASSTPRAGRSRNRWKKRPSNGPFVLMMRKRYWSSPMALLWAFCRPCWWAILSGISPGGVFTAPLVPFRKWYWRRMGEQQCSISTIRWDDEACGLFFYVVAISEYWYTQVKGFLNTYCHYRKIGRQYYYVCDEVEKRLLETDGNMEYQLAQGSHKPQISGGRSNIILCWESKSQKRCMLEWRYAIDAFHGADELVESK